MFRIHMVPVIEGEWSTEADVLDGFDSEEGGIPSFRGGELLYARYDAEYYEGECLVIFVDKEGALWEVNSSHCSCMGLGWEPEETTLEALRIRGAFKDRPDLLELFEERIALARRVIESGP